MKLRTYVLAPEVYAGPGGKKQLRARIYAREQWGDRGEERDLHLPSQAVELGPASTAKLPQTFRPAINQALRAHYEAFWSIGDDIDGDINRGFAQFLNSKAWRRVVDDN